MTDENTNSRLSSGGRWKVQDLTNSDSEQRDLFISRRKREARRKRRKVECFREREEVGATRRARLENRILKESLGDAEERESSALFAQSECKRLRKDNDARICGKYCLELFGL